VSGEKLTSDETAEIFGVLKEAIDVKRSQVGGPPPEPTPEAPIGSQERLNEITLLGYQIASMLGDKPASFLLEASEALPTEIQWTEYHGGMGSTRNGTSWSQPLDVFHSRMVEYAERVVSKGKDRWFMGAITKNGRCRDLDIEAVTIITLDKDADEDPDDPLRKIDWTTFREILEESGIANIAQRSTNNTPDRLKWHISIPLARPWVGEKPLWRAVSRFLIGFMACIAGLPVEPDRTLVGKDGKTFVSPRFGFDHKTDRLGQPIFPAAKKYRDQPTIETILTPGKGLDLESFLLLAGFYPIVAREALGLGNVPETEVRDRVVKELRSRAPITLDANAVPPEQGLLALAFAANGMLGRRHVNDTVSGFLAVCPREHLHSGGTRFNTSTILIDPQAGEFERDGVVYRRDKGSFHCKHSKCGCDGLKPDEILKLLPDQVAVEQAKAKWYGWKKLAREELNRAKRDAKSKKKELDLEEARQGAEVVDPDDGRVQIEYSTKLFSNVLDSIIALKEDPDIFQRAGTAPFLVHLTRVTREEADRSEVIDATRRELVEGTPYARPIQQPTITERLTKVANFVKYDNIVKAKVSILPPVHVTSAIFARGEWPGIPELKGVAEAPFLTPAGEIVQDPGYHRQTQYLYAPSGNFPRIPDNPTPDDAKQAYKILAEVFSEFPFIGAGHRDVPIAGILTLLARPAIQGSVPAFLFDANTPGTGKTLITDLIAIIVTGRTMPRKNYPGDMQELGKTLDAYALAGSSALCFDNIVGKFGGAPLEMAITTTGKYELRMLGFTEHRSVDWQVVIFGSGNNIRIGSDTPDRVLKARMVTKDENPRTKDTFKIREILEYIKENRNELLVAALTVLRAYVVAGRPDMTTGTWGSFTQWAKLIPAAIVWAGGENVMDTRILDKGEVDDQVSDLGGFVSKWDDLIILFNTNQFSEWRRDGMKGPKPKDVKWLSSKQIIDTLFGYKGYAKDMQEYNELRTTLQGLCCPERSSGEAIPTPKALSNILGMYKERSLYGKWIRSEFDKGKKITCWWIENVDGSKTVADEIADLGGVEAVVGAPVGVRANGKPPSSKVVTQEAVASRDEARLAELKRAEIDTSRTCPQCGLKAVVAGTCETCGSVKPPQGWF